MRAADRARVAGRERVFSLRYAKTRNFTRSYASSVKVLDGGTHAEGLPRTWRLKGAGFSKYFKLAAGNLRHSWLI